MSTIKPRHVADLLDTASKNVRSRHNREKMKLTPKQVASWLMALVIDLDKADDWSNGEEDAR